jgi:sugar lactone lactonase YvrE
MNMLRLSTVIGALTAGALLGLGCGDTCSKPGDICTYVGTGQAGFSGDNGSALKADLYLPQDLAFGPDDRAYLLDWNNHRVRSVDEAGVIRTVAGNGHLGDGPPGPALDAAFNHPTGIAFDQSGRMLIAAWHNSKIKRVDLGTGQMEDICGTGARAYAGDDGPGDKAVLDLPASIAFDKDWNLYILDQANQVIRRVDAAGTISRHAGICMVPGCPVGAEPVACPGSGKFTCSQNEDDTACTKPCEGAFGGDDGTALTMRMSQPFGQAADPAGRLAFDAEGNLYFADTKNHRIRRIDTTGKVTTVAGTGERGSAGENVPAVEAKLDNPTDLAIDADGAIYVADTANSCVRRFTPGGDIETFAGQCGKRGYEGDGSAAAEALLDRPYGVALDRDGNLYIADTYNHRFRMVLR